MKEFLKGNKYKTQITEAINYEEKLAYFIQTHLNSDVYINSDESIDGLWSASNPFINWMRGWMRKDNFNSFLKFLRHPLPTTSLVQDDIVPELKKVFDATNSYYDAVFTSNAIKLSAMEYISKYSDYYKNEIFEKLIYSHNSIIITDYKDNREPYRFVIDISNVKGIEPDKDWNIKRIAFVGTNEQGEERWFYYTDEFYASYIKQGEDFKEEFNNPHKIGECPADFISVKPLNNDKWVVRKSIFSNTSEKFENYVNYYTLQKMCLPHGAIPVTTYYKKSNTKCNEKFDNGTMCKNGYIAGENGVLGNQDKLIPCPVCNPKTVIQAGTVIGLPVPKFGREGERPFDLNANFVKFHYIPTDILKWWDEFVDKKYSEIKYQLIGKGVEDSNGQAKNKDQIARGNQTLENTLMSFSADLSNLEMSLDRKLFKVRHGDSFKSVFSDMGTDFYLETEFELRDSLAKAIDPIDKENLISRINYSIYKNNPAQMERNNLMYKLLPYSTLTDDQFVALQVDPAIKELRLNYKYHIDTFEAEYGALNDFFNNYFGENVSMSNKLNIAKQLLIKNINVTDYESVQNEDGTGVETTV
jgi:hypothetical protein